MIIRIIAAFSFAFLVTIITGKPFILWLKEKGVSQPLKVEVARIYDGKAPESEE